MSGRRRALFAGDTGEISYALHGSETGRNSNPLPTVDSAVCFGWDLFVVKAVELLLSSAWLAIIAWLIARAIKQRGLLPRLPSASCPSAGHAPFITMIIPARDEETNIGPCLLSLLAQDYPHNRLRILVVDDHSADATAAIVRELAERHPLISLIQTPSLPPRWTGKSHACWIGARSAVPQTEWLCFIDADVTAEAGALSSAVQAASHAASRSSLAGAAPGTAKLCRTSHPAVRPYSVIVPSGLAASPGALRP